MTVGWLGTVVFMKQIFTTSANESSVQVTTIRTVKRSDMMTDTNTETQGERGGWDRHITKSRAGELSHG